MRRWAFLLFFLGGCQRGCASEWLAAHGIGQDPKSGAASGSLRLDEVDCAGGLARCVGGALELSQAFRHPEPCTGPAERCVCPWETADRCENGCVAEGLEVPLSLARAKRQLCSPLPSAPPAARPPAPGVLAPAPCGDEGYRCTGASVVECDPLRVLAICTRGCAEEGETLEDPDLLGPAAVALLCDR